MHDKKDNFEDHKVFDPNFLKDPFREEHFVYKEEDSPAGDRGFFQIHVDHDAPQANNTNNNDKHDDDKHKNRHEPHVKAEKRSFKGILTDAWRQIVASTVILIIGFFLLNWSAYSQIIKSRWQQFRGIESPLTELAEMNNPPEGQESLQASSDPALQKKQIPALNLEVTPSDNRIIIPRIDQNIPIVRVSSESLIKRDWTALEKEMQEALKDGVVHYPGTSLPGQTGNVVVTGHSSYFPWDPGRFKDVFALLHDVVVGDRLVIYYDQDKYLYEVSEIEVVLPEDIEVLKQTPGDQLTLITCTPIGTNLKRLIVKATPIAINGKAIHATQAKITR